MAAACIVQFVQIYLNGIAKIPSYSVTRVVQMNNKAIK